MPLTAFAQKKLGDIALGIADWTMPAATYLGLFNASPGENGSLASEFSGGNYARVSITAFMSPANAVTGISTNFAAIQFLPNAATHGMLLYGAIIDAATLGNVLFYAPFGNPRVINNGDAAVVVPIGQLSASIVGVEAIELSSYLMKKLVDHVLGKASYSKPTIYHGLLGGNPTIAGSLLTEIGVGGYLRQLLTPLMSAVDATDGTSSNTTDVQYPTPTANYPDVNYAFAADAASGGNLLFANALPTTLSVRASSAPVQFPAGSINFKIA